MFRHRKVSMEEIHEAVKAKEVKSLKYKHGNELDDVIVNLDSDRLTLFAENSTCVCCGIQGEFYAIEYHTKAEMYKPHLNLYAIVEGRELLLTKDHIIPLFKGGKNEIANYQTMCQECNMIKSSLDVQASKRLLASLIFTMQKKYESRLITAFDAFGLNPGVNNIHIQNINRLKRASGYEELPEPDTLEILAILLEIPLEEVIQLASIDVTSWKIEHLAEERQQLLMGLRSMQAKKTERM
jgi:5-methylcytosine-specific restriction endonuclease McrA